MASLVNHFSFSPVFVFLLYQFVFVNALPACPVVRNFASLEDCIRAYWFIGYIGLRLRNVQPLIQKIMHFVVSHNPVWYIFQRRNLIKKQFKHFLLQNCIVSLSVYYHNSCFSLSSTENSGEIVVMRWAPTPLEYLYQCPWFSVLVGGGGTGGREPGRTGGGRGTGDGRRKGGKRDLKKAKFSKSKLSLFVDAYHPVKETTPTTFLDFHLTFSEV